MLFPGVIAMFDEADATADDERASGESGDAAEVPSDGDPAGESTGEDTESDATLEDYL